jgi:hypothetical protein
MRTYSSGKKYRCKDWADFHFPEPVDNLKVGFGILSVSLYVHVSASAAHERVVECYSYAVLKILFIIGSCP